MNAHFGRYEITRELGRGGMATVYEANDPQFGRKVALKVLPREFLHDTQFRARFDREARTIAALEHPSIVPVYDFGDEAGQPYFVMRLMAGGSLVERVARGPMSLNEVARIFEQIAPAIDHAHARGVVHRDLKPGNILFDGNGNAYVGDFGIAKITSSDRTDLTHGVIGTATYMSPEQAKGESLDGRSDIYSLGAILFEMLTGRQPYQAETATGVMMKHVLEPVPQIRAARTDLPPDAQLVLERGMAKQRDGRYANAAAMSTDLEALRDTGRLPADASSSATLVMPAVDPAPIIERSRTDYLPDSTPARPDTPPPIRPPVQSQPHPVQHIAPQAQTGQKKSMSGLKMAVIGLAGSGCLCAGVTAAMIGFGLTLPGVSGTATPAPVAATPVVVATSAPSATARPVATAAPTSPATQAPPRATGTASLNAAATSLAEAATSVAKVATTVAGSLPTTAVQRTPLATPTPVPSLNTNGAAVVIDASKLGALREIASVAKPGQVRQVGFLDGGDRFWAVSGNTANAVSDENQLNVWELDSPAEAADTYKKITGIPWDARPSLDQETILIAHKPGVREYGLTDGGKLRKEWAKFGFDTIRVAVTSDEETIIAGGIEADFRGNVKVIDVASGNQRYAVDNGFNIADLAVKLDGLQFASSNSKGEVMMWDTKTGRKLWSYSLKTNGAAVPIAFNLDGTLLMAGACITTSSCQGNSDSTVVLLNSRDGSVAGSLSLPGETVQALKFTPLGDGVVIGTRARLYLFRTADLTTQLSGQRAARATIPFNDASAIAFSDELHLMIVGGSDALRVYSAK